MSLLGIPFVGLPEIVSSKEAVVLSMFDGDVDGSRYVLVLQEITDVNGLIIK